ncbi:MAG TPA: hypothetical protein VEK11_11360 [Thermoanaerobaculia bacterium]|nr:hypothetical protein [Thermoanaerobaculia bacterium]
MNEHPTHELLDRLRRGGASRDEVLAVTRHLTGCSDCRAAARSRIDVAAAARALRGEVEAGSGHPDLERDLFLYADGARHDPSITAHLTECERCREDVADLRIPPRRPVRRPHHATWLVFATAAGIAAVIVGGVLIRPEPEVAPFPPPAMVTKPHVTQPAPVPELPAPEPEPARSMRPEWAALIERARGGESPTMPAVLRRLRRGADVLRGSAAARALLSPAGIVVESQRPRFTWDVAGGERFEVWLFAEGREVARSGTLTQKAWTPQRPLRRGVTYTWELQVERKGESEVYPMPPAPPAEVHVLEAAVHQELEAARREHAGDHLLLGLLYARAGMIAEAHAELGRVTGEQDVAVARRLRDNLASWTVMSS